MDSSQLDGYHTIQQIRQLSSDLVKDQTFNVIGLLKCFKPPEKTNGKDWMCSLEIVDDSTRGKSVGLEITIFWPRDSMPSTLGVADVVVISKAKAQLYNGNISLLAKMSTTLHILPANDVPNKLCEAIKIKNLWSCYSFDNGIKSKKVTAPSVTVTKYVISMSNDKAALNVLLSKSEVDSRKSLSNNTRDKFSLIENVQPNCFYNIIGEIRRLWLADHSKVTVYLSDYTKNDHLFDCPVADHEPDEDFNQYDVSPNEKPFEGPYGKLLIQLTLWDKDAEYIREQTTCGNWLYIKNVRIKMGSNNILEGSVNGKDRKLHVQNLNTGLDFSFQLISRLKAAYQRKTNWWKEYGEGLSEEGQNHSKNSLPSKRKPVDLIENSPLKKKNKKRRREEKIAQAEEKNARIDAKIAARLELNGNIRAFFPDQPIISLSDILAPSRFSQPRRDTIYAPFTNRKYRANVRVVDYFPNEVENFSVISNENEIEYLSDQHSESEYTDTEVKNKWEWRFSLLLEDATSTKLLSKQRMWVLVDNHAAQLLLSIEEDATNLRYNPNLLGKVKEQLFKLWGDLEEQKSDILLERKTQQKAHSSSLSDSDTPSSSLNMNAGDQPELDSEKESENPRTESDAKNAVAPGQVHEVTHPLKSINSFMAILENTNTMSNLTPSNKAFTCCIQQYGVKLPEDDPTKSNAGPRKRWQRLYGLFGTQIL